jgi:hypothetical protein
VKWAAKRNYQQEKSHKVFWSLFLFY